YDRLWALIPYCPPHPKLEELALIMLGNPSMGYRGEALTYLVEAYPEKHGGLLQKYDQDPSPRVQDAIARQEVLTNPAAAVRRWERIMNRSDLPHDLAETVPASIAYAVDVSELPRFEALAA